MGKLTTYDYLDSISDGDKEFQRDIVGTFLEEIEGELGRLQTASDQQDWSTLGSVAHKIKAPIGMLCVQSMKDLVLKVEKDAKAAHEVDALPGLVTELIQLIRAAMAELEADFNG